VLGATSAIAQAAARIWAERGEELLLVGRDPQKLEAVAADLRTRGGTVETVVHDLDRDQAGLVGRVGAPDVVLLAQGVFGDASRRDRDPEYAESILRTNLISPVRLLTLPAPAGELGLAVERFGPVACDQDALFDQGRAERVRRLREAVAQMRVVAGADAALHAVCVDPCSRVPERRVVLAPIPE